MLSEATFHRCPDDTRSRWIHQFPSCPSAPRVSEPFAVGAFGLVLGYEMVVVSGEA